MITFEFTVSQRGTDVLLDHDLLQVGGRRRPDGAARAFLKVIEKEPDAVLRALAAR